jgi:hypothetical protein
MNAKHTPSDDARALLHYASNARANVADNEADAAYCLASETIESAMCAAISKAEKP